MNNFPNTTADAETVERTTNTTVPDNKDYDLENDSKDEQVERYLEEEDGRCLHYTIIFTTLHYKSTLN